MFILHDAVQKIPIVTGYKKLREIVGEEHIDFSEYYHWFSKFSSGNYDLEDDRSSKPTSFLDLTEDALMEVISHLDVKNRMNVRKVCTFLRDIVDVKKIKYTCIAITFDDLWTLLEFDDSMFYYSEKRFPKYPFYLRETQTDILDKDFQKMVLKDLENVLKSAKDIGFFEVIVDGSKCDDQIDAFLKLLENTKFEAQRVYIKVKKNGEALKILSTFKPEKMEHVCLESVDKSGNFHDLVKMKQFQMAKKMHVLGFGTTDISLIEKFFSFTEFNLKLEKIRKEDVIRIQTALEKLPIDREWTFYSDNLDRIQVEQAIDQFRVIERYQTDFGTVHKKLIPNSEYFLTYLFWENDYLSITKHQ
ncbi:unnamed protein product [Caenorhabditis nigoni]